MIKLLVHIIWIRRMKKEKDIQYHLSGNILIDFLNDSIKQRMKRVIGILLIVLIAIIHVHLNMYTVENPLNPSFWVFLIFESPPFSGYFSQIVSELIVMGIQCAVTSCLALFIEKWNRLWIWIVSYIFCIPFYLLLWNSDFPIERENNLFYWYLERYHYEALSPIIKYSVIQVLYVILYNIVFRFSENVLNNRPKDDHADNL